MALICRFLTAAVLLLVSMANCDAGGPVDWLWRWPGHKRMKWACESRRYIVTVGHFDQQNWKCYRFAPGDKSNNYITAKKKCEDGWYAPFDHRSWHRFGRLINVTAPEAKFFLNEKARVWATDQCSNQSVWSGRSFWVGPDAQTVYYPCSGRQIENRPWHYEHHFACEFPPSKLR